MPPPQDPLAIIMLGCDRMMAELGMEPYQFAHFLEQFISVLRSRGETQPDESYIASCAIEFERWLEQPEGRERIANAIRISSSFEFAKAKLEAFERALCSRRPTPRLEE